MSGSSPLSCSPLSLDDLIDDSYLGAPLGVPLGTPVGKMSPASAAKEEASLLENRQVSETATAATDTEPPPLRPGIGSTGRRAPAPSGRCSAWRG